MLGSGNHVGKASKLVELSHYKWKSSTGLDITSPKVGSGKSFRFKGVEGSKSNKNVKRNPPLYYEAILSVKLNPGAGSKLITASESAFNVVQMHSCWYQSLASFVLCSAYFVTSISPRPKCELFWTKTYPNTNQYPDPGSKWCCRKLTKRN